MSKLHERLLKHKNMTPEQKKNCTCEMCTGLNIHKSHRIEMSMRKSEASVQNQETSEVVKSDA